MRYVLVLVCVFFVQPVWAVNVLLIGDSISLAYEPHVQNIAGDRHDITHIGVNAFYSSNGVANIDNWLAQSGDSQWDVIHFNFGLHDIARIPDNSADPRTPAVLYQANLNTMIDAMLSHSPEANIIFALTTPIQPQIGRIPEDVAIYNELAKEVMIDRGVAINDLYANMLPNLEEYSTDGTHFSESGNLLNGSQVVSAIEAVITPEPSSAALLGGGVFLWLRPRKRLGF